MAKKEFNIENFRFFANSLGVKNVEEKDICMISKEIMDIITLFNFSDNSTFKYCFLTFFISTCFYYGQNDKNSI